ncbi:MAG: hypothetical protein M0Z46_06440 [Actinomycetota bacterium]|nr:hypothetical protein [Actinomycetota bacterium]
MSCLGSRGPAQDHDGRRGPRLYAAHALRCYGTAHERACLDAIEAAFAGWEVVNPAARYRSDAEWLADWPRLVSTLGALVVFADEEGTIGAGCLREVADAIVHGVPLFTLGAERRLCDLVGLDLVAAGERTPAACARPVAGAWADLSAGVP